MVAIVVILAATVSVFLLGSIEDISQSGPNVADKTGDFVINEDYYRDNQFVRITHSGGEAVAVEELEIVVRATGPSLDTSARLVDLPVDDTTVDSKNIEGNTDLIDKGLATQTIQEDDSNVWSAGRTIEFRINTGEADFRIDENNTGPEADTLEVIIVHTPSGTIISQNTFRPNPF